MSDAELIARLRDAATGEHDMTPHGADVLQAADRIEALIAERNDWESHAIYNAEFVDLAVSYRNERDAARAELAKAEEELELQEEEACMMENSYFELEKELNTCRMAQAVMDNTVADLEAKLAKAVEALEPFARAAETWEPDDGDSGLGARIEHPHHGLERHAEFTFGDLRRARATLAEIKGESHE